jgi:CBS domain-containing protein
MTTDVITVLLDAPIAQATELLAGSRVSGLAVVDHRGKLHGVVSTTDILNAEAEAGDQESVARLLATSTVADIMTPKALTVSANLDLREAALQMEYGEVHRLFVEEGGRLIGVISRSDINRAFALKAW